jgi:hypothetical protein
MSLRTPRRSVKYVDHVEGVLVPGRETTVTPANLSNSQGRKLRRGHGHGHGHGVSLAARVSVVDGARNGCCVHCVALDTSVPKATPSVVA